MSKAPETAEVYRSQIKNLLDDVEDAYFLWQIYSIVARQLGYK